MTPKRSFTYLALELDYKWMPSQTTFLCGIWRPNSGPMPSCQSTQLSCCTSGAASWWELCSPSTVVLASKLPVETKKCEKLPSHQSGPWQWLAPTLSRCEGALRVAQLEPLLVTDEHFETVPLSPGPLISTHLPQQTEAQETFLPKEPLRWYLQSSVQMVLWLLFFFFFFAAERWRESK